PFSGASREVAQRAILPCPRLKTISCHLLHCHCFVCGKARRSRLFYRFHPFPWRTVDTLQQKFGKMIRARRLKLGLGQEALADKATIHRTHVSLLERGKRMPSLEVIRKLAAALETSMASLMKELEAMDG